MGNGQAVRLAAQDDAKLRGQFTRYESPRGCVFRKQESVRYATKEQGYTSIMLATTRCMIIIHTHTRIGLNNLEQAH